MRLRDKQKGGVVKAMPKGNPRIKEKSFRVARKPRIANRMRSRSFKPESPKLLAIIERERKILGQDLHDGLCQFLTALRIKADLLEGHLQKRAPAEAHRVRPLLQLLDQAIEKMRTWFMASNQSNRCRPD